MQVCHCHVTIGVCAPGRHEGPGSGGLVFGYSGHLGWYMVFARFEASTPDLTAKRG